MSLDHPRLFISYSHDSAWHMDRVLELADRLRKEGIDVELDQYVRNPAQGWPEWTEARIRDADFVLVIATEIYRQRFDRRVPKGEGLGVKWEGAAIRRALYDTEGLNGKYLPMIFTQADEVYIPEILRGFTRYCLSSEKGYESLYRQLTGQPEVEKPVLGKLKQLPPRLRRQDFAAQVGRASATPLQNRPVPAPERVSTKSPERISTWGHVLVPVLLGVLVGVVGYWHLGGGLISSLFIGLGSAILVGFFWKVWRRLEEKWAKSVADWIDASVRLYGSLIFSGFRRRYFKQLHYRHRFFNIRGLRTRGGYTPELERVFVDLKVAPQSVEQINHDLLRATGLTGKRSIWELLASEHEGFRCIAVIGPPGSGKTTLLQHLALIFSKNEQRRQNRRSRAYVPILLFIRDHVEVVTSNSPPKLEELLWDVESREGLDPPAVWFQRKLQKGKALVLLDGLDEVADREKRLRVVDWVAKEVERYGNSRFIVTSRPHGYRMNPLPAATVLEVQPFTLGQVGRFVTSWHVANEILSVGTDDAGVRQTAERRSQDLMHRLRNKPALAALTVNPLLLTMIAMVHRYRGTLPERRVELYGEICDVLLGHWQQAKGLSTELTSAQKRAVLQPLAFYFLTAKTREISIQHAKEIIVEPLRSVQGASALDSEVFLRDIEAGSGLLVERENGFFSFAHLTFQEFLASSHLLEMNEANQLHSYVGDPWWHETIRLYAAQTNATPIIRACLTAPGASVEALILAYDCLNEGRSVDPEIRDELEQGLVQGLESAEPDRRRLAGEVMLELRLRNFQQVNDTTEIDSSYLSCAEYQIFIDDKLTEAEYRQPDHWGKLHFPKGSSRTPIVGIRSSDAAEVCGWLTGRVAKRWGDAGYLFRLPVLKEVLDNPMQHSIEYDRFEALRLDSVGTWSLEDPPAVVGVKAESLAQSGLNRLLHARRGFVADRSSAFGRAIDRALDQSYNLPSSLSEVLGRVLGRLSVSCDRALENALGARGEVRVSLRSRSIELARSRVVARAIALDLDAALKSDLDLDRDRALVRARERADALNLLFQSCLDVNTDSATFDQVYALDMTLTVAIALSRHSAWEDGPRSSARAIDRDTSVAIAMKRARELSIDIDHTVDRGITVSSAISRAQDLNGVVARGLGLDFDSDLAFSAPGRNFDLDLDLDLAFDRSYDLNRDLSNERLEVLALSFFLLPNSQEYGLTVETYLSLFVLEERVRNRVLPWEGIRMVRERIPEEP